MRAARRCSGRCRSAARAESSFSSGVRRRTARDCYWGIELPCSVPIGIPFSLSVYQNLFLFFPVSIMKIHESIGETESDGRTRRSETFLLMISVACTHSQLQEM